jgi:hypothetical protein
MHSSPACIAAAAPPPPAVYNQSAVRDDFEEPNYAMIDTLFSLAEAYLFMQLVELVVGQHCMCWAVLCCGVSCCDKCGSGQCMPDSWSVCLRLQHAQTSHVLMPLLPGHHIAVGKSVFCWHPCCCCPAGHQPPEAAQICGLCCHVPGRACSSGPVPQGRQPQTQRGS